jgi:arylsulfatase A
MVILRTLASLALVFCFSNVLVARPSDAPPNFVVIFCDDLGYGDLGCFGHPTISTPHLDRMASEGIKFTQFYAAAPVCTPSRAALLTGRLPARSGMCSDTRRVLFPTSKSGLPASEITIAESLRAAGYRTGCVGKWHLGHLPAHLPTSNGFDQYFGIPYSNDMDRLASSPKGRAAFLEPRVSYWNPPLMRDLDIIERPAIQTTITRRYTQEATRFIRDNQERPFFLYLAHSMPHVPLFRSPEFEDHSSRGLYGDVIEEIDGSVGAVLDTLRELRLEDDTLVFFTSDNGPWLIFDQQGGSAGLLRGGKGSTWDGGMREPTVAWWPGKVRPGRVEQQLSSTMDLFATFHNLAKVPLPDDRPLDSHDLTPVLLETGPSSRESLFYYRGYRLMAMRRGPWKMHLFSQNGYGQPKAVEHETPLLYQLEIDPSEKYDVAEKYPEVIAELREVVAAHRAGLVAAESELEK